MKNSTMEEYKEKRKELKQTISDTEKQLKVLDEEFIYNKYGVKIGDVVEYIHHDGFDYVWDFGEIYDFELYDNIMVKISGKHLSVNITKMKKYDSNDYELRQDIFRDRDLKVCDGFQLRIEKKDSTLNQIYHICRIVSDMKGTSYFYLNDKKHTEGISEGEFYYID